MTISGRELPPDLTLVPEGPESSARRRRGLREILIGDEAFDRAVWVEGPPALVRSLLDADTRRIVASLLDGRLERPRLASFWARGRLETGVLSVELPDTAPPKVDPEELDPAILAGPSMLAEAFRAILALAEGVRLGR